MTAVPSDDIVRLARAVAFDVGEDHIRYELRRRLERIFGAVQAGVGLAAIADDLRHAAVVAESDPVDRLLDWLAQVEADARRALERAA